MSDTTRQRATEPESTAAAGPSAFSYDRLTVTCVVSFCLLVAGLSSGVVLGELRDELDLSGVVATAHGSMFGVGLLVVGAFGLGVVARLGRPRSFWAACAAIAVGVGLLCIGRHPVVTLTGCLISGFAAAVLVMLMPGILADHHRDHRAEAFAAVNGIPGFAGIGLSVVIGGAISAGVTWRWPYAALTLGLGAAVVLLGRGVRFPVAEPAQHQVLRLFRDRSVLHPWFGIVHAVLCEFPVGVLAVVFLKEAGGASGGLAAILAGVWGLSLSTTRLALTRLVARAGLWSRSIAYLIVAAGSLVMWAGPWLAVRTAGLVIVGIGAAALYPLSVDRLYLREGADTVSLGAIAALASGTAIVIGPLGIGLLADAVGVRDAILAIPVLAVIGVFAYLPSLQRARAPIAS